MKSSLQKVRAAQQKENQFNITNRGIKLKK